MAIVALHDGQSAEPDQRKDRVDRVAQRPAASQALNQARLGFPVCSLVDLNDAECDERFRPIGRRGAIVRQGTLQPVSALMGVASTGPEAAQGGREPEQRLVLVGILEPRQGRSEVRVLRVQQGQDLIAVRQQLRQFVLLGEVHEIGRMPLPDGIRLAARHQPFTRIFADRLQHPVARCVRAGQPPTVADSSRQALR